MGAIVAILIAFVLNFLVLTSSLTGDKILNQTPEWWALTFSLFALAIAILLVAARK